MKKLIVFTGLFLFAIAAYAKYEVYFKLDKVMIEGQKEAVAIQDEKSYEDDLIQIVWEPTSHAFNFSLFNKTSSSISIIWDECTMIDFSGTSGKVIHAGVKFIAAGNSMPPTIVPMQAKVSDLFFPVANISYGKYSRDWIQSPIYKGTYKDKDYEKIKNLDLSIRTILVIQAGDQKKIYHFFFKGFSRKL